MSISVRIDQVGEIMTPPGVVIDASDRFDTAPRPETDQEHFYWAVYGSGVFVVSAECPEAAADVARCRRTAVDPDELALPLAMRLTDEQAEVHISRCTGNIPAVAVPEVTTLANPGSADEPMKRKQKVQRPPKEDSRDRLFSWVKNAGTGKMTFLLPTE